MISSCGRILAVEAFKPITEGLIGQSRTRFASVPSADVDEEFEHLGEAFPQTPLLEDEARPPDPLRSGVSGVVVTRLRVPSAGVSGGEFWKQVGAIAVRNTRI